MSSMVCQRSALLTDIIVDKSNNKEQNWLFEELNWILVGFVKNILTFKT